MEEGVPGYIHQGEEGADLVDILMVIQWAVVRRLPEGVKEV